MLRFRDATLNEVLELDPGLGEATKDIARRHEPFGLWRFERDDLVRIGGQLPGQMGPPFGGQTGALGELFERWIGWIRSADPNASGDRATHDFWLGELRAGRRMLPPVLYYAEGHTPRHILDGRHRLFAALEYATEVPSFELELYWSDAAAERARHDS